MTIKQAQQQVSIFMKNSGLLISWNDIYFCKKGTIRIDGVAYNITGQKKITL